MSQNDIHALYLCHEIQKQKQKPRHPYQSHCGNYGEGCGKSGERVKE